MTNEEKRNRLEAAMLEFVEAALLRGGTGEEIRVAVEAADVLHRSLQTKGA